MTAAKRKSRILLVDGNSTVQHLRALMLRMRGFNVDTAVDLDAARTVISAGPQYDLLIVDVGHFAGSGIGILRGDQAAASSPEGPDAGGWPRLSGP